MAEGRLRSREAISSLLWVETDSGGCLDSDGLKAELRTLGKVAGRTLGASTPLGSVGEMGVDTGGVALLNRPAHGFQASGLGGRDAGEVCGGLLWSAGRRENVGFVFPFALPIAAMKVVFVAR